MASILVSDAPYASWLSDVLAMLEENKIDRICVAAPLPGGEVFTGYYHMDMMDKAVVATSKKHGKMLRKKRRAKNEAAQRLSGYQLLRGADYPVCRSEADRRYLMAVALGLVSAAD